MTTEPAPLASRFPPLAMSPQAKAWCVTPDEGRCIHRFFDSSPFSPSGRYLALTRLPYEDRLPMPGDAAGVVLVDLVTGQERTVAHTLAWDTQLGAQVQWGATDAQLLYNDLEMTDWRPFGVQLDPFTGTRRRFQNTVYHVSSDGRLAVSACLRRIGRTQPGYGVNVPQSQVPSNIGASPDDGVYLTDLDTGESRLLASIRQLVTHAQLPDDLEGSYYVFHTKWNSQGDRLMVVLRRLRNPPDASPREQRHVLTMRPDGSDIHVAVHDRQWRVGGHHPHWCPDGRTILMNLRLDPAGPLRFVAVKFDGSGLQQVAGHAVGSGHPSLHPSGNILTDTYPHEPMAHGDSVPIRWIGVATGKEVILGWVPVVPPFTGPRREFRVDPHPAWDRQANRFAFNLWLEQTRRVCVAQIHTRG